MIKIAFLRMSKLDHPLLNTLNSLESTIKSNMRLMIESKEPSFYFKDFSEVELSKT